MVSSPSFANSLTISNAAAGHYGLVVITVAAASSSVVLLYQGWTYYVFRKRLGGEGARLPVAMQRPATTAQSNRRSSR